MPWNCCGASLNDDVSVCPKCAQRKQKWTLRFQNTRRLVISRKRWVEFEALDELGNPLPEEPYEAVLADGSSREGTTDEAGFVRLDDLPKGKTCRVIFPMRDQRETSGEAVVLGWVQADFFSDDGAPLVDEPYEVLTAGGSVVASGRLDVHGRLFEGGLKPGSYRVRLPERTLEEPEPPLAPRPEPSVWLELELHDELGRPLAGETVQLTLADGSTREETLDEHGALRLEEDVPAGSYTVKFVDRDPTDFVGDDKEPPEPAAGDEPESVGWLELELYDECGHGLGGERIVLKLADGSSRELTLDPTGSLRVGALPDGPCSVTFPDRCATDFVPAEVGA